MLKSNHRILCKVPSKKLLSINWSWKDWFYHLLVKALILSINLLVHHLWLILITLLSVDNRSVILLICYDNDLFSTTRKHASRSASSYTAWIRTTYSHTNVASFSQKKGLLSSNKSDSTISRSITHSHSTLHHSNIHKNLTLNHLHFTHLHLSHPQSRHSHLSQYHTFFIPH